MHSNKFDSRMSQLQGNPQSQSSLSQMVLGHPQHNHHHSNVLQSSPPLRIPDPSSLAWRQLQHTQSNYASTQNDDDIESDELEESDEDDDDDEEDQQNTQASTNNANNFQANEDYDHNLYDDGNYDYINDDELYKDFIHQYMLTNEDAEASNLLLRSDDDEEDEEDYEPEESGSEFEDDEDDEDDDDLENEGNRVQKKELRDLLNDCWLTIADADITLPEYDFSDRDSNNTFPSAASQSSSTAPVNYSHQYFDEHGHLIQSLDNASFQEPQITSHPGLHHDPASYMSPRHRGGSSTPSSSHMHATFSPKDYLDPKNAENKQPFKPNANLVSSFVTQVFAGNKPSEICINGVPVGAIRKVVARQMAMALQLLIQILFLAENRSECWKTAYSSLLHLTNLRESAVKKAALMQMNLENVAALRNFTSLDEKRNAVLRNNEYKQLHDEVSRLPTYHAYGHNPASLHTNKQFSHHGVNGGIHENTSEGTVNNGYSNRRVTRSTINYNSRSNRTSSIFDIPVLSRISDLMMRIDNASKRIQHFQQLQSRSSTTVGVTNSSIASEGIITQLDAPKRHELLHYCANEIEELCNQLPIKSWTCLIPTANYPFRESYPFQQNSNSVTGQTHFSPAEDDLLLRGILNYGEDAWDMIRASILPSKDPQLLYYRYCQQTIVTSNLEYNDFKRFKHLASQRIKKRNREDRWSLPEDLNLLRGYEIFGEKWPLVVMFFLPHLKISDVRMRWGLMQKIWNKAFPHVNSSSWIEAATPGVKAFLLDLHQCRDFKDLKDFAEYGGNELRKLQDVTHIDENSSVNQSLLGMDPITERLTGVYDHSMYDQDELSDSDHEDERPTLSSSAPLLANNNPMLAIYSQPTPAIPQFAGSTIVPTGSKLIHGNKRVSFAENSNMINSFPQNIVAMNPNSVNYAMMQYPQAMYGLNPIITTDALSGPLLLNNRGIYGTDDVQDHPPKANKKRGYASVKNRVQFANNYNHQQQEPVVVDNTSSNKVRRNNDMGPPLPPQEPILVTSSTKTGQHYSTSGIESRVRAETHEEVVTSAHQTVGPEMDFSLGGFSNITGMVSLMKPPGTVVTVTAEKQASRSQESNLEDSRSNFTLSSGSQLSSEGIFAQVTSSGRSKLL